MLYQLGEYTCVRLKEFISLSGRNERLLSHLLNHQEHTYSQSFPLKMGKSSDMIYRGVTLVAAFTGCVDLLYPLCSRPKYEPVHVVNTVVLEIGFRSECASGSVIALHFN